LAHAGWVRAMESGFGWGYGYGSERIWACWLPEPSGRGWQALDQALVRMVSPWLLDDVGHCPPSSVAIHLGICPDGPSPPTRLAASPLEIGVPPASMPLLHELPQSLDPGSRSGRIPPGTGSRWNFLGGRFQPRQAPTACHRGCMSRYRMKPLVWGWPLLSTRKQVDETARH